MNAFDIFLMEYTFALRILIFLRHTDAFNSFTAYEQNIINRNIIDDILISNIKNYLRWDMFQKEDDSLMIRLFWRDPKDYYGLVEILHNIAQTIEQIKPKIDQIEKVIEKHIQIIKDLDMTANIYSRDNGLVIDRVMRDIYRPDVFTYFMERRAVIINAYVKRLDEKPNTFYYPCLYSNDMDTIIRQFQHLTARTHYLGSIDTHTTSFDDKNQPITDSKSFDAYIDHIVDYAKKLGNTGTIANTAVIKQFLEGREIIVVNKTQLDALCIAIVAGDNTISSTYENYYLWMRGMWHNLPIATFTFFFSVYDPFQNFFTKTFTVSNTSQSGKRTHGGANPPKSMSTHVVYLIAFLIVILFAFYLIWQKNRYYTIQPRMCAVNTLAVIPSCQT